MRSLPQGVAPVVLQLTYNLQGTKSKPGDAEDITSDNNVDCLQVQKTRPNVSSIEREAWAEKALT